MTILTYCQGQVGDSWRQKKLFLKSFGDFLSRRSVAFSIKISIKLFVGRLYFVVVMTRREVEAVGQTRGSGSGGG
jgi:hypothetical protein